MWTIAGYQVKALEVQNVVHYDLKCDNVLLEPLECTLSEEDFWQPRWPPLDSTRAIPFRVSITDFGQSKVICFMFIVSFWCSKLGLQSM